MSSMEFSKGTAGWGWFAQLENGVFDCKYIHDSAESKAVDALAELNYYQGDSGNLTRDLKVLDSCDKDAIETNSFYKKGNGALRDLMQQWIQLTKRLNTDKQRIDTLAICKAIDKYNENLEMGRKQVIKKQLLKCVRDFNAARHVKHQGKGWYKDDIEYDLTGREISWTWKYDATTYYYMDNLQSLYYQDPEQIASAIESMERQSRISFMNPRNWKQKITKSNLSNW